MIRYCSLYSGSSGNSFFIQSNNTNILIDAGVSAKKIVSALSTFKIDVNKIDAILVTHEHSDHTKGLATLSNNYNIPIFANKKTWEALDNISSKIKKNNIKYFDTLKYFKIGDFKIFSFPISHDAIEPCGFNIYYDNKKISIATDIGSVSTDLLNHLKNSTSIFLESNYDPNILKYSSYPYILKKRILGNDGHLSNESAGKVLATLYNSGLRNAILVHLSKENNFPELAYKTVFNEIVNCKNFNLDIAPRDTPSKMFEIK